MIMCVNKLTFGDLSYKTIISSDKCIVLKWSKIKTFNLNHKYKTVNKLIYTDTS